MAVNKVVYGEETLIDLTSDTITEEVLLWGETAHKADGNEIVGKFLEGYPERFSLTNPLLDSDGDYILDNSENVMDGTTVYKKA